MTVNKLIKLLQKMPPKAKVAIDSSYSGNLDWKFSLIDIKPEFHSQVPMHEDWHENQRGKPKHLDMVVLGTIVGDVIE
jgi:hypothetical protein